MKTFIALLLLALSTTAGAVIEEESWEYFILWEDKFLDYQIIASDKTWVNPDTRPGWVSDLIQETIDRLSRSFDPGPGGAYPLPDYDIGGAPGGVGEHIPEPGVLALLGLGLLAMGIRSKIK